MIVVAMLGFIAVGVVGRLYFERRKWNWVRNVKGDKDGNG